MHQWQATDCNSTKFPRRELWPRLMRPLNDIDARCTNRVKGIHNESSKTVRAQAARQPSPRVAANSYISSCGRTHSVCCCISLITINLLIEVARTGLKAMVSSTKFPWTNGCFDSCQPLIPAVITMPRYKRRLATFTVMTCIYHAPGGI